MFRCIVFLFCALLMPLLAAVPSGTDFSQLNQASGGERNYRHRTFCAYKPLAEVSLSLKVGAYSAYENPTGIYYTAGEKMSITLHNKPEGELRFIIRDFRKGGKQDVYPLVEGQNDISVKNSGLGYVDYRSPKGNAAGRILLSLHGGVVNGVFSQHDENATWKKLLAHAPAGVLDMIGERCQIVYDVEGLRRGNPDKGAEMLALYDRIVELEQEIMGWDAEGIHPGNHMLCRVVWSGYMYADGLGAAFVHSEIPGLSAPDRLRRGAWGVAHELGHVNQVKPDFTWAGMMEVSNNVYSAWCNYVLDPTNSRLEHEVTSNLEGVRMRGGRFDCYINNALVNRQLWGFTGGPDSGTGRVPGKNVGDHFVSVCPLWQLMLYFHVARGQEDFYPTIFRSLRAQKDTGKPHGQLRMNFCGYATKAARCNLNHFFLHTGMLGIMNRRVPDYAPHMVTVSEGMVEKAVRFGMNYPQPDSSVIYYINANNVHIYRDRLPVTPSPNFVPQLPKGRGFVVFPKAVWQNAVAFEVYEGKKLIRVCLRGLGQEDNASTTVVCPSGTTEIRAVQWDGRRYTVIRREQPVGKR